MWQKHFTDVIEIKFNFGSFVVDPDLWYRAMTTMCGTTYYEYILVYVDDILIIDKFPE